MNWFKVSKGWANWRQQVKSTLVAMGILMAVMVVHQAWASYNSSAAVLSLPSFIPGTSWLGLKTEVERPTNALPNAPIIGVREGHNAELLVLSPHGDEPDTELLHQHSDGVLNSAKEKIVLWNAEPLPSPSRTQAEAPANRILPHTSLAPPAQGRGQHLNFSVHGGEANSISDEQSILESPVGLVDSDNKTSIVQKHLYDPGSNQRTIKADTKTSAPSAETYSIQTREKSDRATNAAKKSNMVHSSEDKVDSVGDSRVNTSLTGKEADVDNIGLTQEMTIANLTDAVGKTPKTVGIIEVLNGSSMTGLNVNATFNCMQQMRPSKLLCPSSTMKELNWPLSELEIELSAAKQAIAQYPLDSRSSDFNQLYAPIYHNVSEFKKSYELMEKMFRVYVYKEGKKPLVHEGPITGIYASEGLFIREMEINKQFVVDDHRKANAFFLPYSVEAMVIKLYVPNSHSMKPLATFIKDYVELIAAKYPFWNRTEGGDHFFVSCHDWGPATARDHAALRENAIKVVCNADTTEEFVIGRDASLPEFYIHSEKLPSDDRGGPGPKGRQRTLAFFAGQMHGRVRPQLLQYWEFPKGGPEMQIFGVLPKRQTRRRSYEQRMKASKYCICAMGYEVNSPRIVEAIYNGCVPVIIADGFVLPFSDVLDWSSFSITIPETDIPSLKSILKSIPESRYRTMQSHLRHVRRHFLWHQPALRFDTFHMILHSVWASRLRQLPR